MSGHDVYFVYNNNKITVQWTYVNIAVILIIIIITWHRETLEYYK